MIIAHGGADLDISIHALVKRATFTEHINNVLVAYFNPRPREEGDFRVLTTQLF